MYTIVENGKNIKFEFDCPVCGQKWLASADQCCSVYINYDGEKQADMCCENCGATAVSTDVLVED